MLQPPSAGMVPKLRRRYQPVDDGLETPIPHAGVDLNDHGTRPVLSSTGLERATALSKPEALIVQQENKNEHSESGEITFVPNPIPETEPRPTQLQITGNPPTISSSLPTQLPSNGVKSTSTVPVPTFIPLPFLSLAPTQTVASSSSETIPSPSSFLEPLKPSATSSDYDISHQSHKLSTPIIILLAVGSGLLLTGILIIVKVCTRPTRRQRPTPSLPILRDSFSDFNKFQAKDSPIFGGQEKVSPFPSQNSGAWSWTQYTQPEQVVSKSTPVARPPETSSQPNYTARAYYPFVGHAHTSSVPMHTSGKSLHLPPMQQAHRGLGRAERRSSAPSMSPYFSSPRSSFGMMMVNPELKPTKALDIDRDGQRSGRKHVRDNRLQHKENPCETVPKRFSQGFAYDGAVVSSPTCVPVVVPLLGSAPSRGGRARIKSTYLAPGSYPRTSNLPTSSDFDGSGDSERPHKPYIQKSASRRDRDTQALTYALGLSSPDTDYAMPSPQPTLYPDDSLSVVERRSPKMQSRKKHAEEDRPSLPKIFTDLDGSAALGSLMLMDFGVEQTDKKAAASSISVATTPSKLPKGLTKVAARNNEKTPHIPSPPLMPSLAQMALENDNPETYADYRSPTYSIYGFYEHERKSGMGS